MAWDFTADSEIQKTLATTLDEGAGKFDDKIAEMYGEIGSLSAHWVGEDYKAYVEGTERYKDALKHLSAGIRMFSKHFEAMSAGTEELAQKLADTITNATSGPNGSGTGGGSGLGAGTGGDGSQTGGDGSQTGGDGSQTGGDGSQTGGDGSQTGGDGSQTGGDGSQTGGDGSQTGGDGSQTGGGANDGSGDDKVDVITTYTSGDMIKINGEDYGYYGSVKKPNGELVDIVTKYNPESKKYDLYYRNANGEIARVQASTVNGSGQTVTYAATVDDIGGSKTINAHGYNVDVGINVDIDGISITGGNKDKLIASSVTYTGVEGLPTNSGVSGAPSNSSGLTLTSDGSTLDSFSTGVDGGTVNGYTLIKAMGLSYITNNAKDGVVVQIPQGIDLQWDPAWNVNGYDFDTKNGPIYLMWDSNAASGNGAFHLVDEYGNVKVTKDFTLDGFNDNAGHWK